MSDYWGPLVRFAARSGNLPLDQAEDVAAETLVVLLRSPLLARWHDKPASKLRTLLCGVVRNLLSNQNRIAGGRRRLLQGIAAAGGVPGVLPVADSPEPSSSDLDTFYHAWVDELLAGAMRESMKELHAEGRGDCFRALYGRVCENLTATEIAAAIGITTAEVENYVRLARARLTRCLQSSVRSHVEHYGSGESREADFQSEWDALHWHLEVHGGLEQALRLEASRMDRIRIESRRSAAYSVACAEVLKASSARDDPKN